MPEMKDKIVIIQSVTFNISKFSILVPTPKNVWGKAVDI